MSPPGPDRGYRIPGYDEPGYDEPVSEAGYDEAGYPEDAAYGDDGGYADGDAYDDAFHDADPEAAGYGAAGEAVPVSGSRHSRRRRRRERRHHPVLVALGSLVVVVVLLAAGLAWWANHQISAGARGPEVSVVIPHGASTRQIGSILARDGIIRSARLFPYYIRLKGASTLYPGTYRMAKDEGFSAAIATLEKPPPVVRVRLVIPEGFTVAQIAAAVGRLPKVHISAAQFLAAADGGRVRSPYEPAGGHSLEGLLYPATYPVTVGESATELLQQMVDAFDANAAAIGLSAGASRLGYTPYQVVTVASMVEREAKRPEDRGPVASVIYNRLKDRMALGIDSTLLYGLHTANAAVNPDTPSPYNTRIHRGLPPTPIANPGLAALTAAVRPPPTKYLYYAVTGPGGQTSFASSAAGFAQIQAECRARGYCS